jgi:MFS family permease
MNNRVNEIRSLSIKAVIIGLLVDIVGSFVAMFFISVIAGFIFTSKGLTQEQIVSELSQSSTFMNIMLFTGFLFTFIGGYVTALIAGREELRHAFVMGLASFIFGVIFTLGQDDGWGMEIISLFVIPFALLGGYLRKITKKA